MTCPECEKIQAEWKDLSGKWLDAFYVRVGVSNIMVIGCKLHVKALLAKLSLHEGKA